MVVGLGGAFRNVEDSFTLEIFCVSRTGGGRDRTEAVLQICIVVVYMSCDRNQSRCR